jgi:hypothetical protein
MMAKIIGSKAYQELQSSYTMYTERLLPGCSALEASLFAVNVPLLYHEPGYLETVNAVLTVNSTSATSASGRTSISKEAKKESEKNFARARDLYDAVKREVMMALIKESESGM